MKRIFITWLCLSTTVFAANPSVEVTNFNFEYQDPKGHGTADSFSAQAFRDNSVTVDVEKQDKDFLLKVQGAANGEYVLKNAPELLTSAKNISLQVFNLNFNNNFSMSLDEGYFESPDSELLLQKLSLSCVRNNSEKDPQDQIVGGCTQQLTLKSSKFTSNSLTKDFINSLVSGVIGAKVSNVSITGLDLKINGGNYNLSAEVKAQISGKAKSYGQMTYDSSNKVLTIKITEVKFSVLNVTNQVFDELKKNENEKMKVSKPYVYLTLK